MFRAESELNLALSEGGHKTILGRIVELPSTVAFYRFSAREKAEEWVHLDSRLLWYLLSEERVRALHVARENVLAQIRKRDFWLHCEPGPHATFRVARALWTEVSPWYDAPGARRERIVSQPVPQAVDICRAGGKEASSYRRPHVPVAGLYDGKPRMSCAFCGRWLDENEIPLFEEALHGKR